jgi:hypothetical protein
MGSHMSGTAMWHRPCYPPEPWSVTAREAVKLQRANRSRSIELPGFRSASAVANGLATACRLV